MIPGTWRRTPGAALAAAVLAIPGGASPLSAQQASHAAAQGPIPMGTTRGATRHAARPPQRHDHQRTRHAGHQSRDAARGAGGHRDRGGPHHGHPARRPGECRQRGGRVVPAHRRPRDRREGDVRHPRPRGDARTPAARPRRAGHPGARVHLPALPRPRRDDRARRRHRRGDEVHGRAAPAQRAEPDRRAAPRALPALAAAAALVDRRQHARQGARDGAHLQGDRRRLHQDLEEPGPVSRRARGGGGRGEEARHATR